MLKKKAGGGEGCLSRKHYSEEVPNSQDWNKLNKKLHNVNIGL